MKKIVAVKVKEDTFLAVELEDEDILELRKRDVEIYDPEAEPEDPSKKKWAFIAPLLAGLPATSTIVGAASLGVVGGVAAGIGKKVLDAFWPKPNVK